LKAPKPSLRTFLVRALRLACPVCGRGALFRRYFVRKEICSHCGWRFERGHGHWIGGAELHMFASYGLSVILFAPLLIFLRPTPFSLGAVIFGHVLLSIAMHRYSRAIFLGIDYLVDPDADPDDDDGEGGVASIVWPPAPRHSAESRTSRQRV